MPTQDQILKLAGELQEQCHEQVELIMQNDYEDHGSASKISNQDATNIYLFQKLAELTLRIQELENDNNFFIGTRSKNTTIL